MENNRNPLNGYRYDVKEPGIETGIEQMRKLVKNSSSENTKTDSAQDKAIKSNKNEIKKVSNEVAALKNSVYTKSQADGKFLTEHQSLEDYAKKADVYTKEEVDAKIPEDVDLTGYAKEEYVDNKISELIAGAPSELDTLKEAADAINTNISNINTISAGLDSKANVDDVYTKGEVDELLKEKAIEIYNLTKIVGDMGGSVTYELPNEYGKSFGALMGNNGTVKLVDDVETGRFGPGITARNNVKLNLNSHNLMVTGLTISSSYAAIMARGTEEITIGGKGTINAGGGICIHAYGADTAINLTGSTTIYRTNRSGGELIYCYAGTINITNGTFINDGENKGFMLNCYDANYRNGTAKIVVTGGKFYDFDPGNNTAEGEGTSFLAEGYESVASTVVEEGVEHTVYTVKKTS